MQDQHDGDEEIERRLVQGRQRRLERRRTARRITLAAAAVLLVSLLAVPDDWDWLHALLLSVVVALYLASALVSTRGDEAARARLATVSMWGLLGLGVATLGVGVGYSLAEEPIPADLALFGPILTGMVVVLFADAPSGADPKPTVWDEWRSRAGR